MDRPPADYREGRRLRAWELSQAGWAQRRIAEALGVTEGAVSQWLKRAREGGPEALRRRIPPGPAARLTDEQRARIPELLARGAEAYGFRGDVWTTKRVAAVISHELGVRYHRGHISKLLAGLGLSPHVPTFRATQRDEAAIAAWRDERWPALEAKPASRGGRSSGSTRPASGCSPAGFGPMPHGARRRSCAAG